MCEDLRLTLRASNHSPPHFFFQTVFQWTWGSLIWLYWLSNKAHESSCLFTLPSNYRCWGPLWPAFMWVVRIWTQVLTLLKRRLTESSSQTLRVQFYHFTKPHEAAKKTQASEVLSRGGGLQGLHSKPVHHPDRTDPWRRWEETNWRDSHV